MKRILIINAAALLFASAAFAGGSISMDLTTANKQGLTLYGGKTAGIAATNGDPGQKLIAKTSTGVGLGINSGVGGYAVVSQHKNGVKAYGSSYDSTAMYMADAVKGTVLLDVPSTTGANAFPAATWTTM